MPYVIGSPDETGNQGIVLWGYVIGKEGVEPVKEAIYDGVPRLTFAVGCGAKTLKNGVRVFDSKLCSLYGNSNTAVIYGYAKNLKRGDYIIVFGKLQTYKDEDENGMLYESSYVRVNYLIVTEKADDADRAAIGITKKDLKRAEELGEEDYAF